jgi:RES domain
MVTSRPATRQIPESGIWRIGRGNDPIEVRLPDTATLMSARTGNRFDSPAGSYGVLYFASDLRACFGETLARFRPSLPMQALVADEWQKLGFMDVGAVPREWRHRRTAVRVALENEWDFVDIEARSTHQFLRRELALGLSALGYQDLDVSTVRGPDRRVTRLISDWAFNARDELGNALYGGIRYCSRLDTEWELWAVFGDVVLQPIATKPILLESGELQEVAADFGLTVH